MKERLWLLNDFPERRTNLKKFYKFVYRCNLCLKDFGSDYTLKDKICFICYGKIKIRKSERR